MKQHEPIDIVSKLVVFGVLETFGVIILFTGLFKLVNSKNDILVYLGFVGMLGLVCVLILQVAYVLKKYGGINE